MRPPRRQDGCCLPGQGLISDQHRAGYSHHERAGSACLGGRVPGLVMPGGAVRREGLRSRRRRDPAAGSCLAIRTLCRTCGASPTFLATFCPISSQDLRHKSRSLSPDEDEFGSLRGAGRVPRRRGPGGRVPRGCPGRSARVPGPFWAACGHGASLRMPVAHRGRRVIPGRCRHLSRMSNACMIFNFLMGKKVLRIGVGAARLRRRQSWPPAVTIELRARTAVLTLEGPPPRLQGKIETF